MMTPASARSLLKRLPGLRLLVLGDIMLDHYVWGDATRISPEAPVPVVDIAKDTYTAGGAANVALNIAALGGQATVMGALGRDEAGDRLRGLLDQAGIRFIDTKGSGPTIVKTRVMVQHQQLCRLDREGPPPAYGLSLPGLASTLRKALREHDAVLLSDYAKGLLHDEAVAWLQKEARAAGCFIALDPKPKRPLAFSDLDLITPNRREALQLAGISANRYQAFPAAEVVAELERRYRTRHVVITLSEDGMLLASAGQVAKTIPTAAREVCDVSGAGDTALASLTLALVAGAKLETAAHFANACAGVVVGKLGTATVTPDELLAYLRS